MIDIKLDPVEYLNDNACKFLFKLERQDLAACCQVNKIWNEITNDDYFWNALVPGIRDIMKQDENLGEQTARDYLSNRAVTSFTDVHCHFEKFIEKRPVIGLFKCLFPFNPECYYYTKVQFAYCDWMGRKPVQKELCIFIGKLPIDKRDREAYAAYNENYDSEFYFKGLTTVELIQKSVFTPHFFCQKSSDFVLPRAMKTLSFPWLGGLASCTFDQKLNNIAARERSKIANEANKRNRIIGVGAAIGTVALVAYGAYSLLKSYKFI